MPRFSLISIGFSIAGFAGYFALFAVAGRNDSSLISWLANALGLLYGTLLYTSGLSAFYVACRSCWCSEKASELAVVIPFAFLPAFIGVIGLVHGYISVYQMLSYSGTVLKPIEMLHAHATVLVCSLVGLCFSFVAFAMLSIGMVVKSRTSALRPEPNHGE